MIECTAFGDGVRISVYCVRRMLRALSALLVVVFFSFNDKKTYYPGGSSI